MNCFNLSNQNYPSHAFIFKSDVQFKWTVKEQYILLKMHFYLSLSVYVATYVNWHHKVCHSGSIPSN